MTDRELLELAAKAAKVFRGADRTDCGINVNGVSWPLWNPLADDGDALRLAVLLRIDLMNSTPSEDGSEGQSAVFPIRGDFASITEWADTKEDKQSATRRAIVRAAAEIGKAMHGGRDD